jgi:hypothetical protein
VEKTEHAARDVALDLVRGTGKRFRKRLFRRALLRREPLGDRPAQRPANARRHIGRIEPNTPTLVGRLSRERNRPTPYTHRHDICTDEQILANPNGVFKLWDCRVKFAPASHRLNGKVVVPQVWPGVARAREIEGQINPRLQCAS